MLNISKVILVRTDSNLCRKELTVHWSGPNSLIKSYLQPCTNSMWGDESESVSPFIWLYQTVDARKEGIFFPDLLITLRRHAHVTSYVSHEQTQPRSCPKVNPCQVGPWSVKNCTREGGNGLSGSKSLISSKRSFNLELYLPLTNSAEILTQGIFIPSWTTIQG